MGVSSKLGRLIIGAAALVAASAASAQQLQEVTIGLSSSSLGAAGYRLAKELDLFKKQGLEPKFVVMDSGNAVTTALISGSLQLALAGMGEIVAAQARGRELVAATNTYGGPSGTLVLAKAVADKLSVSPNASPTEQLKALDGLVIAGTTPTSSNIVSLGAAVKRAGGALRPAYMAQETMQAALESGAVQGFIAAAPFWSFPITRGTAVLWLSGPKGELPPDLASASSNMVQVMRPFGEANRDLLKKMDAIYQDFQKALDERPADVKAAISKLYPSLDRAIVDMLYEAESVAWRAQPLKPEDVAKEINLVKMSGSQVPDLDKINPAAALLK